MSENTTDLLNEIGCDTFQRDAMMATIDEIIDEIENYSPLQDLLPTDVKFPCTNILLFGGTCSGKSSVYNTMNSVFRGKIFNTALSGGCEHALTKKLRKYPIMPRTRKLSSTLKFRVCNTHGIEHDQQNMLHLRDGINADRVQYTMTSGSNTLPLPLKFRIWDIRGLEQNYLMTEENMRFILEGNIPDHFHFDPSGNISSDISGIKKHPGLDERIHCVAIVQDVNIVDAMIDLTPEVTKNIKDMQTVMNDLDIPQVVILTKIDNVCEATKEDPANALKSQKLKRCVAMVSEIFGLTKNSILLLKNYEKESHLDPSINLLALQALKVMLNNCDAHLYHHFDDIVKRYTVRDTEIL